MEIEFTHTNSPYLHIFPWGRAPLCPMIQIMKDYDYESDTLGPATIMFDATTGKQSPAKTLYTGQLHIAAVNAARLFDRLIGDDPAAIHDPAFVEYVCEVPFSGLIDPDLPLPKTQGPEWYEA